MHRVKSPHGIPSLLLASALAAFSFACSAPAPVVVEVLPPRTSVTCAAPAVTDPALGRGLLDIQGIDDVHGGYVGDLRLSVKAEDAHVTGLSVSYEYDGKDLGTAIKDAGGALAVGDVVLAGDKDDLRAAVLENVPLVPRSLAQAIAAKETEINQTDFTRIDLAIQAEVDGELREDVSGFSIDVCDGCLLSPPTSCDGTGENTFVATVCRAGQDIASFKCITAGTDE